MHANSRINLIIALYVSIMFDGDLPALFNKTRRYILFVINY